MMIFEAPLILACAVERQRKCQWSSFSTVQHSWLGGAFSDVDRLENGEGWYGVRMVVTS